MGWNLSNKKRKTSLNRKSINNTNISAKNIAPEKIKMDSSLSNLKSEETNSEKSKKIWSLESLVQAMVPSNEELQFREEKSKDVDLQKYSKSFSCTKCNRNLKLNSVESDKIHVHPCLGVLMCQSCCNYYEDGEFSLDSEGEDKYCRWCGEGGTIFGCSQCICGFCVACIKKHFGFEYLRQVQKDDDWLCFFCQPKPLWDKRYICSLAVQASENKINETPPQASKIEINKKDNEKNKKSFKKQTNQKETPLEKLLSNSSLLEISDSESSTDFENWCAKAISKDKGKKRDYTSSSDETEGNSPEIKIKKLKLSEKNSEGSSQNKENLRQLALEKLQRVLKLSEYQMVIGVNWSSKMLKKLTNPKHVSTSESLRDECEKIKWFLSILSSYLVEFCNSVDSVEKSLSGPVEIHVPNNLPQQMTEPTGFSSVMEFLNFATNQVKTFMNKGLTLRDILEADIYDDNKFIGIKKKSSTSTADEDTSINVIPNNTSNDKSHKDDSQNAESEKEENAENSSRLVVDQEAEVDQEKECDGDTTDISTPGATKDSETPGGPKEDILKILEILENA